MSGGASPLGSAPDHTKVDLNMMGDGYMLTNKTGWW